MKNTYKIALAIMVLAIIVIGGMSMKDANTMETPPPCWTTIDADWDGTCVVPDPYAYYYVTLTIIDECHTPHTTVYTDDSTVPTTETDYEFCVTDTICDPDHSNACWHIIYTVAKLNKSDNSVICSGYANTDKTCDGLSSGFSIGTITLN